MARKGIRWTEKQKEIAELFKTGKRFTEIATMGYSLSVISKVKRALEKERALDNQDNQDNVENQKVKFAVTKSKQGVVAFRIKDKEIIVDPDDLYESYFLYLDIKARSGIDNSFSDAIKAGMETVWLLTKKPLIENEEVKCLI